jgi:hypothetical protein
LNSLLLFNHISRLEDDNRHNLTNCSINFAGSIVLHDVTRLGCACGLVQLWLFRAGPVTFLHWRTDGIGHTQWTHNEHKSLHESRNVHFFSTIPNPCVSPNFSTTPSSSLFPFQFQSSYQQDSDFWSLLTEHTYYLLPLVFESALPDHMDRASYYHTAGWMSETAYRVYHLLPLVAVLAANFVSKVCLRPCTRM